jgi:hypothetical protein
LKFEGTNYLIQTQNPDGGWGYFPGKESASEPSAFALLALLSGKASSQESQRGRKFLTQTQLPAGGWAVSPRDTEPAAWISALAAFSLYQFEGVTPAIQSAAAFVLKAFARLPLGNLDRLVHWLSSPKGSSFNTKLGGWSWNPETAPWVEPTCCALIFLKKIRPHLTGHPQLGSILNEAEMMLYDRICTHGGWNYGNARVLGEDLHPYPITTALALIALQDLKRPENKLSLEYLKKNIPQEKSLLSLSLCSIALSLFKVPPGKTSELLINATPTDFLNNTKTAALISIATQPNHGEKIFHF